MNCSSYFIQITYLVLHLLLFLSSNCRFPRMAEATTITPRPNIGLDVGGWKWEEVVGILDSWDIPNHFELVILSQALTPINHEGFYGFQRLGRGMTIQEVNHSQFTDIWNIRNPFLILIHTPSNQSGLRHVLQEVNQLTQHKSFKEITNFISFYSSYPWSKLQLNSFLFPKN